MLSIKFILILTILFSSIFISTTTKKPKHVDPKAIKCFEEYEYEEVEKVIFNLKETTVYCNMNQNTYHYLINPDFIEWKLGRILKETFLNKEKCLERIDKINELFLYNHSDYAWDKLDNLYRFTFFFTNLVLPEQLILFGPLNSCKIDKNTLSKKTSSNVYFCSETVKNKEAFYKINYDLFKLFNDDDKLLIKSIKKTIKSNDFDEIIDNFKILYISKVYLSNMVGWERTRELYDATGFDENNKEVSYKYRVYKPVPRNYIENTNNSGLGIDIKRNPFFKKDSCQKH